MNKLAKRTLAILLVVCALFGLVAMPAAALAEPTQTEPKTYVYDFTAMSQTKTVAEGAEAMWKISTNTNPYYGFGNRRFVTGDGEAPDSWMNSFYEVGYRNGGTTAEPIYYYKDLNWKVSVVKRNEVLDVVKANGSGMSTAQMDRVTVGGYYYNNEANKFAFNGLRYQSYTTVEAATLPEGVTSGVNAKETFGGWVAITIKAPEVGTYTVSLDHMQNKYGTSQGSVYIVPGAVSDVDTIQGYVDNGTGKLENTVDYFESRANLEASTAANKVTALGGADAEEIGLAVNTTLGTVTLSEPYEEYTVIFTSDLNREGTTDVSVGRVYIEGLTFTQQAEAEAETGEARTYELDGAKNGVRTALSALAGKYTDNTTDGSNGGYVITSSNAASYNTYTVTNSATNQTSGSSGQVLTNCYFLSMGNSFTAGGAAKVYYYTNIDTAAKTCTIDTTATVTNLAAQATMADMYETLGWEYLGNSIGTGTVVNNGYLYIYGTNSAYYAALKMKSPGEGEYELDLGLMHAYSSTGATLSHIGMKVYILEAPANTTAAADYKYTTTLPETPDAYYKPVYQTLTANTYDYNAQLVTADGSSFTYDFEEGKDYIVILQRDTETTKRVSKGEYSPDNIYLTNIYATPLPATVATVGEDYTPVVADYNFCRTDAMGTTMKGFATTGASMSDLTGGYSVTTAGKSDITVKLGDVSSLATSKLVANYNFLRMNNSSVKADAASTAYYYTAVVDSTYTIDTTSPVTNYNAKKMLDDMYGNGLNWKLLGSSTTTNVFAMDADKMYIYNISGDNYVVFKIKAPGTGEYAVDLSVKHASDSSTNELRHMGMKVYIMEDTGAVAGDDDYKLSGVSLPETPNAQYKPAYNQNEQGGEVCNAPLTVYGEDTEFTYNFDADKEYLLILQRDSGTTYTGTSNAWTNPEDNFAYRSTDNIWLAGMTATPTREASTQQTFTTLTAALAAAAETGKTVHLEQDVLLSEVVIPAGVTLDLNGYTLTTAAVGPTGKLVGEGVVKTYANKDTFTNAAVFADNTLPLYDADAQGYKFYQYSLGNGVPIADEAADAVKFWYQFQFTGDKAAEAYALVASGTSGLTMGVNVTANGENKFCSFENKKDVEPAIVNDPAAWAAAYASFAANASDPWLWVNVTSASLAGDTLNVAPVIRAGGADIVGANIQ